MGSEGGFHLGGGGGGGAGQGGLCMRQPCPQTLAVAARWWWGEGGPGCASTRAHTESPLRATHHNPLLLGGRAHRACRYHTAVCVEIDPATSLCAPMTLATCNEFGLCTNHYTLKFGGRIPTGFSVGTQIPVGATRHTVPVGGHGSRLLSPPPPLPPHPASTALPPVLSLTALGCTRAHTIAAPQGIMSVSAWRRRQREIFDRVKPPFHPMAPHVPSNVPTWAELLEFAQGMEIAELEVKAGDDVDDDEEEEGAEEHGSGEEDAEGTEDEGTEDEGGDDEEAADLEAEEAAIRELKSQSWLERRLRWDAGAWWVWFVVVGPAGLWLGRTVPCLWIVGLWAGRVCG